jgi:hypothetical protein
MRKLTHLASLACGLLRRRRQHTDRLADVNLWCRASTLLVLREREHAQ